MLIIFSVNDQKITHDLKGQLVAGSVDIVQAAFKFDSSWDELDKIVVFTSSACPKPVPVQFADEAFYIPKDVLKPGKLYVSVVGFGLDGRKKTTQKWDIMQAITVQKCGDGGDCDLLARVKLLELILSADVTGNPYYVTFNTLTDVVVSAGIWNESDGRIEF